MAQLERELKFEKSKGFLNSDYSRIKEIRAEIAQLQQTPEMPLPVAIVLLIVALILLASVL